MALMLKNLFVQKLMRLFLTLINLKIQKIFASNIYRNKILLIDAEDKQHDIKILLNKLRNYNPTKPKKIKAKKETLSAAEKLLINRQEVIDAFKTGIFLYIDGFQIKKESEEELEEESEEKKLEKIKDDSQKFIQYIE